MTGEAIDLLTRCAFDEAVRTQHSLILVRCKSRAAVLPKAICKRYLPNLSSLRNGSIKLCQIITRVIRISSGQDCLNEIIGFGNALAVTVSADHHGAFSRQLSRVNNQLRLI